MGFFNKFRGAYNAMRAYQHYYAGSASDEEAIHYHRNKFLHEIRLLLEMADRYHEGRYGGAFEGEFEKWLEAPGGHVEILAAGRVPPPSEEVALIRDAWHNDNLYEGILSGDAGALDNVGIEALEWFAAAIDIMLQENQWIVLRWRSEYDERMLCWSGHTSGNPDWRVD